MSESIVCTGCPVGCLLCVSIDGDSVSVEGNRCPRGYDIALAEITGGRWVFTSIVAVEGGGVVPVRATAPIPISESRVILEKLKTIRVLGNARKGDIVLKDVLPGVDIVLERDATLVE